MRKILIYILLFISFISNAQLVTYYPNKRIFTGTLEVTTNATFDFKGTEVDSLIVDGDTLRMYIDGSIFKAIANPNVEIDPIYSEEKDTILFENDTVLVLATKPDIQNLQAQIDTLPNRTDLDTTLTNAKNYIDSQISTIDGSETKVNAGINVTVTGTGTVVNPYVINAIDSIYYFAIALSDSSTELTTANGDSWDALYNYKIDSVRIGVNKPPTGSTLIVDIKKNGTSIFSTMITIDDGDSTSVGSTISYVLSTTDINYNDRMQAYAQSVGLTYGGAGLKVYIYGKKD